MPDDEKLYDIYDLSSKNNNCSALFISQHQSVSKFIVVPLPANENATPEKLIQKVVSIW